MRRKRRDDDPHRLRDDDKPQNTARLQPECQRSFGLAFVHRQNTSPYDFRDEGRGVERQCKPYSDHLRNHEDADPLLVTAAQNRPGFLELRKLPAKGAAGQLEDNVRQQHKHTEAGPECRQGPAGGELPA